MVVIGSAGSSGVIARAHRPASPPSRGRRLLDVEVGHQSARQIARTRAGRTSRHRPSHHRWWRPSRRVPWFASRVAPFVRVAPRVRCRSPMPGHPGGAWPADSDSRRCSGDRRCPGPRWWPAPGLPRLGLIGGAAISPGCAGRCRSVVISRCWVPCRVRPIPDSRPTTCSCRSRGIRSRTWSANTRQWWNV